MDEIEAILQKYEFDVCDYNNAQYSKILDEILEVIEEPVTFSGCNTSGEKVRSLKSQYIYTSKYVSLFFEILRKYRYNFNFEIQDAMFELSYLDDPNRNKDVISKYLNSPVIQDICFDGKSVFKITSEKLGEFSFMLATSYYSHVTQVMNYIRSEKLPNHCHDHAYFLAGVSECKKAFAVTSLCGSYFNGTYYHSYMLDKEEGKVTDLCMKAVLDKDVYYRLYRPRELSVISNYDVLFEDIVTRRHTNQPDDRCHLLRIALYKQYLESIGYEGPIAEGPSLKKII